MKLISCHLHRKANGDLINYLAVDIRLGSFSANALLLRQLCCYSLPAAAQNLLDNVLEDAVKAEHLKPD